jgi:NhaP-type Na+/H+ or K+/H+ antiporter
MHDEFIVTVAVVVIASAVSHVLSRRARLPIAVFLLAAGVLFGPELAGWVRPDSLGDLLRPAIALAVAIVVFEGAFSLDARALRVVTPGVRNLVTVGLMLTIAAGTVISHYLVGFEWQLAVEFGALISVTGPTVISPLLQRVEVNDRVRATLLGEAVIIDPLGAIAAVVALEVLQSDVLEPARSLVWIAERLGLGLAIGAGVGVVAAAALRRTQRRLTADEMWLAVLALALGVFALAERTMQESGLVAVVGLGLILGNAQLPHEREVRRYEDSVSVLVIGGIFVILAAQIEFSAIRSLGWTGLGAVLLIVFAVRPLVVFASTLGTGLYWRERTFIAAVGPRGVVAASFATFAALNLREAGIAGASDLVGLVFLTIIVSVVVQSAWAPVLASALRVKPMHIIVAGAGRVGQLLARRLIDDRESVVLIDSDEEAVTVARDAGLQVVFGDITQSGTLEEAGATTAKAFVAATESDKDNLLACQLALSKYNVREVVSMISDAENRAAFQDLGIRTLNPVNATAGALDNLLRRPNLSALLLETENGRAVEQQVEFGPALGRTVGEMRLPGDTLIVLVRRGAQLIFPHGETRLRRGDIVTIVGQGEDLEFARRVFAGEVPAQQAAGVVSS